MENLYQEVIYLIPKVQRAYFVFLVDYMVEQQVFQQLAFVIGGKGKKNCYNMKILKAIKIVFLI